MGFTAILKLVFHRSVIRSEDIALSLNALLDNLVKVVTSHVGTQANKQVERLLGVSLVHIAIHDKDAEKPITSHLLHKPLCFDQILLLGTRRIIGDFKGAFIGIAIELIIRNTHRSAN
ncbi:hypothetical protein OK016_17810 [Vibrio chagasii]|nr:hypothetical protein [Vibrio chagasii]